jgi:hypothetical protein
LTESHCLRNPWATSDVPSHRDARGAFGTRARLASVRPGRLAVSLSLLPLACGGYGHQAPDAADTGAGADVGSITPIVFPAWPGSDVIAVASTPSAFGPNLSGLAYEPATASAPAGLWAVQNDPSKIYQLIWNGSVFTPSTANGWSQGKTLLYPNGEGSPDSEGLTRTAWESSEMYVVAEGDNLVADTNRPTVLRYELLGTASSMVATHAWDLTSDLPATLSNKGLEGIAWIPDDQLVARGFFDEGRGATYDPASYAEHSGGIFLLGTEATGMIYGYVLMSTTGAFQRVASFGSGQAAVMDLSFDRDNGTLFSLCDSACNDRITLLDIGADGRFAVRATLPPPPALADMNNEGIALAPESECVAGHKAFFWADDDESNDYAIRRGTILCGRLY